MLGLSSQCPEKHPLLPATQNPGDDLAGPLTSASCEFGEAVKSSLGRLCLWEENAKFMLSPWLKLSYSLKIKPNRLSLSLQAFACLPLPDSECLSVWE